VVLCCDRFQYGCRRTALSALALYAGCPTSILRQLCALWGLWWRPPIRPGKESVACYNNDDHFHIHTSLPSRSRFLEKMIVDQTYYLLWNPKVYCHVYKNPPLVPIVMHVNPVYILPFYFPKKYFNITLSYSPKFVSWSPFRLSNKILYAFLISACYMPCPCHHPWCSHRNSTCWRVQIRSCNKFKLSST
jgi:hypothetical protein